MLASRQESELPSALQRFAMNSSGAMGARGSFGFRLMGAWCIPGSLVAAPQVMVAELGSAWEQEAKPITHPCEQP